MYIVTSLGLKTGMSHYVLSTYRHVFATLVIAPFALVLERKIRPKMTLSIFLRIMVLGFLEPVFDQNLYYVGLRYTSATFASASINVLPAITFIMAIIFRLESVNFKNLHSVAKVIGTVITVSGAMVMTLYKGPALEFLRFGGHGQHASATQAAADQHWALGTMLLLASCGGWSAFFILQSFTLKKYPAELSLVTWICLMGTLQNAVLSFIMEHDMSVWKLGFDARLLAAAYSGIVCSGIAYYVQSIVIKQRGPVFVTTFSPLCMIITAFLGGLILAEDIRLGSVIGAVIIVTGLYTVVWGKSKDAKPEPFDEDGPKLTGVHQELPIIEVKTIEGPALVVNINEGKNLYSTQHN
jgi:drug/metabolite transporter (DMT)-like permease